MSSPSNSQAKRQVKATLPKASSESAPCNERVAGAMVRNRRQEGVPKVWRHGLVRTGRGATAD